MKLSTGRHLVNPFNSVSESTLQAQAGAEMAVSSALSNENPNQCPKCGTSMTFAKIATGDQVYYCEACRVTNPIPSV